MTWIQLASLCLAILVAIFTAGWAIFRPLMAQLLQSMLVDPLNHMRNELQRNTSKFNRMEIELARIRTILALRGMELPAKPDFIEQD